MKLFKLVLIFLVIGQIFSTPLMRTCEMMPDTQEMSCCSPNACECDNNLPEKIDAVKKQVKTASFDFHFDYKLHSILEEIVFLEETQSINSEKYLNIITDPPRRLRAKLQVFII